MPAKTTAGCAFFCLRLADQMPIGTSGRIATNFSAFWRISSSRCWKIATLPPWAMMRSASIAITSDLPAPVGRMIAGLPEAVAIHDATASTASV